VIVFAGTVCGDPQDGETPFWDWSDWPSLLAEVLRSLAPKSSIPVPLTPAPKGKVAAARERLGEIGESALEGLLDEEDEDNGGRDGLGASAGQEIAKFSELTRDADFAKTLLRAASGSRARLTPAESQKIFAAVAPYLDLEFARKPARELMEAPSPGTAALGLRVAGRIGDRESGPRMVAFVGRGLALLRDSTGAGEMGGSMTLPDGKDEELRFAAAQGLADLADPSLVASLRKALAQWQGERNRIDLLAVRQQDIEEMITAALAAMGDGKAAAWIVDRRIENSLAREAAIDITEQRSQNPSPEDIREKKRARERIGRLATRNRRIDQVLVALPIRAWARLGDKAGDWHGEFATESLLLVLGARPWEKLSAEAKAVLGKIRQQNSEPAVQAVCRVRLRKE